jgi:hypothetical protein
MKPIRSINTLGLLMAIALAACTQNSGAGGDLAGVGGADGSAPVDMSQNCSGGCGGGTGGCPQNCTGCMVSELCCPWSGGACMVTDAGTCQGASGFKCATPTALGVCPNQCYP